MGREDEFGSSSARLWRWFWPDVQRPSLADNSTNVGTKNHYKLPWSPSFVFFLWRQTNSAAHCVLSITQDKRVCRSEGEVGEENSPEIPKVKQCDECRRHNRIYLFFFRHDDHRVRHPTSRKANRRKTEQTAKHPHEELSRSANEIVSDFESPDCIVSEWNSWSNCSKSCGLGEKFRTRTIVKASKKGGLPCPQLSERSWCGSSRCKPSLVNENIGNSSYFKW